MFKYAKNKISRFCIYYYNGISNVIAKWLQICVLNFSMALCLQLFYIGPFVRFLFKKIFKNKV